MWSKQKGCLKQSPAFWRSGSILRGRKLHFLWKKLALLLCSEVRREAPVHFAISKFLSRNVVPLPVWPLYISFRITPQKPPFSRLIQSTGQPWASCLLVNEVVGEDHGYLLDLDRTSSFTVYREGCEKVCSEKVITLIQLLTVTK